MIKLNNLLQSPSCNCESNLCPAPTHNCVKQHPNVCGQCGAPIQVTYPPVRSRKQTNKAALKALTCSHPSLVLIDAQDTVQVVCGSCFMVRVEQVICPACGEPATAIRGKVPLCDRHSKYRRRFVEGAIRRYQDEQTDK